jgi:hypothetical protein
MKKHEIKIASENRCILFVPFRVITHSYIDCFGQISSGVLGDFDEWDLLKVRNVFIHSLMYMR